MSIQTHASEIQIEKRTLKDFSIYNFCIHNYIITHWMQANEGLLSIHAWPEGSVSRQCLWSKSNGQRLQVHLALYCKISVCGEWLVYPWTVTKLLWDEHLLQQLSVGVVVLQLGGHETCSTGTSKMQTWTNTECDSKKCIIQCTLKRQSSKWLIRYFCMQHRATQRPKGPTDIYKLYDRGFVDSTRVGFAPIIQSQINFSTTQNHTLYNSYC